MYCNGNPIIYIDPNGEDWYSTTDSLGTKTYHYNEDIFSQQDLDKQDIEGIYAGMTCKTNNFYLGLFGNHAKLDTREANLLEQIDELILKEIDYSLGLILLPSGSEVPSAPTLRFTVPGVDKKGMVFYYAGGKGVYRQVQENRGHIEDMLEKKKNNGGFFNSSVGYFFTITNESKWDFIRVVFSDDAAKRFRSQYNRYFNRRKSQL